MTHWYKTGEGNLDSWHNDTLILDKWHGKHDMRQNYTNLDVGFFSLMTQWHIDYKDRGKKFQFMTQWHIDFKDWKRKFQFMTQWHIDFRHKTEKKWHETEAHKNLNLRIFQLMTHWL